MKMRVNIGILTFSLWMSLGVGAMAKDVSYKVSKTEVSDLSKRNVTLINHEIYKQFNVGFGGGYSIPFASNIEGETIWKLCQFGS